MTSPKFRPKPGEPTQKTQPKGIDPKTGKPYEPIEIPVPKRGEVFRYLERAAKGENRDRKDHPA